MKIKTAITVILLTVSTQLYAALTIEITKGFDAAIPIAVVPFSDVVISVPVDIAEVVRNDLRNSGQFAPLNPVGFAQEPHDSVSLNYSYWRGLGADNIVVGRIQSSGDGRYNVNFELLDIYRKNQAQTSYQNGQIIQNPPSSNILLSQQYSGIEGTQLRRLAHHISDVIFEKLTGIRGAFSTRIAYIATERQSAKLTNYSLVVADADGHNPQTILTSSQPLMSPRWSPDAKRLAYVSFERNRSGVYIVDVASGHREQLTKFPGINGAPSWSPDGRQLALVLSKDGAPKIYVINLLTRELRRVTEGSSIDTEPSWFPDGERLLFTSNRGGKPQIYQVSLLTGNVSRITFQGDFNARASLSPDGNRIVMIHRTPNGVYNIAVQDLKGDALTILTHASLDESPTISPNGTMVLYGTQEGVRGVLGAVSIDGRVHLRLPAREGSVQEPTWSPFL